jgi:hypothetical protein
MKDGCVFSINNHCRIKGRCGCPDDMSAFYNFSCKGTLIEKIKCPEWGETLASEEYYKKRLKTDGK